MTHRSLYWLLTLLIFINFIVIVIFTYFELLDYALSAIIPLFILAIIRKIVKVDSSFR